MIQKHVDRAKKAAIKSVLKPVSAVFGYSTCWTPSWTSRENEDLPNTTNRTTGAGFSARRGSGFVYIRTLVTGKNQESGRAIDTATNTGQYL